MQRWHLGYRLMLKRQQDGESMGTLAHVETVIALLTATHLDTPPSSWELLHGVIDEGMRSIDQWLKHDGPLEPHRFSVKEANQRLLRGDRGPQCSGIRYRAAETVPPPKCFGFVQTYDPKLQVVFLSDLGGSAFHQRPCDRLVSHHDASNGAAAADEGVREHAPRNRRRGVGATETSQAPPVAREY